MVIRNYIKNWERVTQEESKAKAFSICAGADEKEIKSTNWPQLALALAKKKKKKKKLTI